MCVCASACVVCVRVEVWSCVFEACDTLPSDEKLRMTGMQLWETSSVAEARARLMSRDG